MIRHSVIQGEPEWYKLRLGIPTASCFDKILTKTGKLSAQAIKYKAELIAEWLLAEPMDDFASSEWMARGEELEGQAVSYYELLNDVKVDRVGFVTTDDGWVGCSPDGLVGEGHGLEIKTPGAKRHVLNILQPASKDYWCQVQGCLWVCECDVWDRMSYNPQITPLITPIERDEKFIALLSEAVGEFVDDLKETREKFLNDGYQPREL